MTAKKKVTKKKVKKHSVQNLTKLFLTPCKTRDELYKFITFFFGLKLPDKTVSRYADTNPFEMVWRIYDICVNRNNPDSIKEILYVAGRGSGKCSVKDSSILTTFGPKYIQNIKPGDIVFTGWNWQKVVETFDEGLLDGVKVTTSIGEHSGVFNITGSLKHRIQAVNDSNLVEWTHLKDLKKGQLVYKALKEVYVDVNSTDYQDGWLVGTITGGGLVRRNSNHISLCSADFTQLRYYVNLVHEKFHLKHKVKRVSKKTVSVLVYNKNFKEWYGNYVSGELYCHKKLKTLEHSNEFLAGFISGLMDTSRNKDGITLASKDFAYQVGQILNMFGVSSSIDNDKRGSRYSRYTKSYVEHYKCTLKTKLFDYLLPLFGKRALFIDFRNKMDEQYRYPSSLIRPFASCIKDKYEIADGYWRLNGSNKTRSYIPFAKELWGQLSKDKYVYGYKIKAWRDLAIRLNEQEWVDRFNFILNGTFETVKSLEFDKYYFYDLEVEHTHSYWSNGFISHNTLGMAIVELLVMLHDKRDVCHVGAVMAQAKRCYDYQVKFMLSNKIKPIIDPASTSGEKILQKMNMEKSVFLIDDEHVSVEVLPCTLKALNGPHVPLVVADEIDTVSGEGLKAFKEISGMLDSKNGRIALRVGISTRKSRYGLMNTQMENAEKEGRHVYRWTTLEFSERCPDSRSGVRPVEMYVIQDDMTAITRQEWELKDEKKRSEFTRYVLPGSGCLKCPAASVCLGDAKKQTSTSPMLKPIDEFIQKIRSEGSDWALSQLMNLKPSVEGIIYKEFNEKIHVMNWNTMWYRLTGTEFPGECSHDIFVKKCHQESLPCYAGIDWGWSSPSTVVYFFVDRRDNVYVVRATGMTYVSQPEWIHHLKYKYHGVYRCQLYFPDVADMGSVTEMQKNGLPTSSEVDKSINTGIQVVKKFLKVPGSMDTKIFIASETCQPLIHEFKVYHFKTSSDGLISEIPDTEDDHWLDALRYPMTMLFSKSTFLIGEGGLSFASKVTDDSGNFTRTPSAEEFANTMGIDLDTSVDTPTLGKIGTISELITHEEDDDMEGSGGFIWSF